MPATYSHVLITDEALDQFSNDGSLDAVLRGNVLNRSHFAHLGCVSPDYPYLDLKQPEQKMWADHMHYDATGELLRRMVRTLLERRSAGFNRESFIIPFAWTLGYVSHVTADLVVHPVVRNIVGDYVGHEAEHRECEMLQDVYIYHRVRNGAEIRHSEFLTILRNCADPATPDNVHPELRTFWGESLRAQFTDDYTDTSPMIDEWNTWYLRTMGIAGRPRFLGRIADPDHKYTYRLIKEITPAERTKFIDRLPYPGGAFNNYDDLFNRAVAQVARRWAALAQAISTGSGTAVFAFLTDCNLDTGTDNQSGGLVCWA